MTYAPIELDSHLPVQRLIPKPGPVFGSYPQREPRDLPASARLAWWQARSKVPTMPSGKDQAQFLAQYDAAIATLEHLSAHALSAQVAQVKSDLAIHGFTGPYVAQSFALIAWQVRQQLGLHLYRNQVLAAWWMLGNRLVELATGEGKTLAALLVAATGALAGIPVHVLTSNDYLAQRDAHALTPIFAALGLSVACVLSASLDAERGAAYACSVTYTTATQVVFDYLRDHVKMNAMLEAPQSQHDAAPALVLRGLCMAVVDEADSVMIDDARMPLILSQTGLAGAQSERFRLALFLAKQLRDGVDFLRDANTGEIRVQAAGSQRLAGYCSRMSGPWTLTRWRDEQIGLALTALYQFRRDVHYLVRDDEVHIIDANTGRRALGRMWSRGLHQLIALKENVPPPPEHHTLVQTTYQRFFPSYLRLCGLSGTLKESSAELLAVYGLQVVTAPLRTPSRRVRSPVKVFAQARHKWAYVVSKVMQLHELGQPVLIGTDSVEDSERLSAQLARAGLAHRVLNASQDEQEAKVIAMAGERGAITVATHMAGRGSDIVLHPSVVELGGLHVMNCHLHHARRIDRQLDGRCARQGAPGSVERVLSLEDEPWERALPMTMLQLLRQTTGQAGTLNPGLAAMLLAWVQKRFEDKDQRARWAMLQQDVMMSLSLAWSGTNSRA